MRNLANRDSIFRTIHLCRFTDTHIIVQLYTVIWFCKKIYQTLINILCKLMSILGHTWVMCFTVAWKFLKVLQLINYCKWQCWQCKIYVFFVTLQAWASEPWRSEKIRGYWIPKQICVYTWYLLKLSFWINNCHVLNRMNAIN